MTELLTPHNGEVISLHTELQDSYIKRIKETGIESANEWLLNCKDDRDQSYPVPVIFQWKTAVENSVFEIAEDETFANARRFYTSEKSCKIETLKAGTTYYWSVNGCTPFVFETAGLFPRFIRIDGVINVRDLGGLRIRQGLLYRGGGLNSDHEITDAGRRTFCEELGIKTELDLRVEHLGKMTESPAGKNVQLKQIPYRPYKEIFEPQHKEAIREIMDFFADEAHYPVYFHCAGGADRTGMIAMYLRAIAGETDEDIHLDYELTSLSNYKYIYSAASLRSRTAPYYVEMLDMLAKYGPEKKLTEQIIAFLDSCGVTEACRQKIREIIVSEKA